MHCFQALGTYKCAMEVSDKEMEAELGLQVDALLQQAATTKAERVLLRAFANLKESGPLRAAVQKEMISLCAAVGKANEKIVLHPLLQQKARDALAFKK